MAAVTTDWVTERTETYSLTALETRSQHQSGGTPSCALGEDVFYVVHLLVASGVPWLVAS